MTPSLQRFLLAWVLGVLGCPVLGETVVDPTFSLDPSIRGQVDSICVRPEGKILLGGKFKLADELRYVAVQLDAEGRLDPEFQPLRTSRILDEGQPVDLALPSDGYALLTIGGSTQRISPDGRDVRSWGAFGAAPSPQGSLRPESEDNFSVTRFLTPLPDGKVMAWGADFWTSGTGAFSRGVLNRMFADGRLDPDFSVAESLLSDGHQGSVLDFSVARNGDYLVTQDSSNPVLRLSPEGGMQWGDSSLRAIREAGLRSAAYVRENAIGDVLVVGTYNSGIHRLSAQGVPDDVSFDPPGYWRRTKASVLLRDGRLLDSGPFTNIMGLSRPGLVCLAGDGSVDLRFDPGLGVAPTAEVRCMTEDPQGRVLLAGSFAEFDGVPAAGLVRIFTRNPGLGLGPTNQFYARLLRSTAPECGAPQQVRVTRAGDLEGTHEVPVRAESGTAVAGEDFVPLDTTLVFGPGERFKTVTLKMVADQVPEPDENFLLRVGPTTPEAGISVGAILDVSILSLDCEVNFSTNRIQIGEGSLQSSDPSSWVSVLSPWGTTPVHVKSRDLSAVAGRDYPAWDVRMGAGLGARSIVALDNPTVDRERSFLLEFVDEGEGFLFGSSSNVVVTIRDDDTPLGAARWISGGVDAVHALPGGRWLLSGPFDRVDGILRAGLARFGTDGSFDPSFRPPDFLSETSPQVAVDSLGRVWVAGNFPPALDPDGLGLIRLGTEGELNRALHISSHDAPLPQCRGASNVILNLWVGPDDSLMVSGILPRFSNCRTPAHVVRLSAAGERTDSWVLPNGLGGSSRVWDDGTGRWIVMGSTEIDRLTVSGMVESMFDLQSHPWARYPLNGLPWAGGILWVESTTGDLMQMGASGIPRPLKVQVLHHGQVLVPIQWSAFLRRSANEVLASAIFTPANEPLRSVVPLLLRMNSGGKVLGFSEIPSTEFTSTPSSLAVGDRGEIAGPSGAWRGGLQWWRFHPDLTPVADLNLEAVLPADEGGAFLRLKGQAPQGYAIEVSDDLRTWRPGSVRPETHWGQTFLEPGDNPADGARFYRVRF
ncbi:MAG: Calx-beta domain-containing protein [Verrucomicrobiota bacterium]